MAITRKAQESQRAKIVTSRIERANRDYTKWEDKFECKHLDDYYDGTQWRGIADDVAKHLYCINLVHSTIELQEPSVLFYNPRVRIEPRPRSAASPGSDAGGRAELCQDTVQTFIDDPDIQFKQETLLALRDAWSRFAVIEVGYTPDYLDNPNAGKPVLNEQADPDTGEFLPMVQEGQPVLQPSQVLSREQLFVKRIPPEHCRVSVSAKNLLTQNDWFAYYEWHYVEDVKANPKYKNTADLKAGGSIEDDPQDTETDTHAGMIKIWKVWDLRRNLKHVIADNAKNFLLEDEPYAYFPIQVLKFFERRNQFYPLPPVYNWLSPQDEINESREQQRAHRRKFNRKFTAVKGTIDQAELDKLMQGPDGTTAWQNVAGAILNPVPDAPLDGAVWANLAASEKDFYRVTFLGAEGRGIAESQTATQANIINVRSQIQESKARVQVAEWLGGICRLMLLCLREKMQLPMWIQHNVDPFAMDVASVERIAGQWQQITSERLKNVDVDVKIDLASLSPISEDAQRAGWLATLAMLKDPQFIALAQPVPEAPDAPSPILRKTLALMGIKSEREVQQLNQAVMKLHQDLQAAMMIGAMQKPGSPLHPMQAGAVPAAGNDMPNPGTPAGGPFLQ